MPDRSPAAEPDLDRAFLEELSAGDSAFEAEILSVFIDSAAQSLVTLKNGIGDQSWRDHAHKLKGAAEAVGARRLAALAGAALTITTAERTKRSHSLAEIDAALNALRDICRA